MPIFTTIKTLLQLSCAALLATLAWYAWQTPAPVSDAPSSIRLMIPHSIEATSKPRQLWRVITRRLITKTARLALKRRLTAMHLKPIKIQSMEEITMHAFDDAELFTTRKQARIAARFWQQHNIPSNVIKVRKNLYLLGLGRFYQPVYATGTEQQLTKAGRAFRYQKRNVPVPTWRFTFAASNKNKAEKLWRKLNASGIIMPVIMSENQFQASYGTKSQQHH
ncbi:MAG: hypothetical protein Q9M16_06095 [Mariprofundus sp.]|nr:hypothetical protein [Mariprofundus sp.]